MTLSSTTQGDSSRDRRGCELVAEVLRSAGQVRLRALGASMLPAVWPGDILHVHRSHPEEIRPGDIIMFARAGGLVAHRVVEKLPPGARGEPHGVQWLTRGDRHRANDAPVSMRELLGRVTAIERRGRRIHPRPSLRHRAISHFLCRSYLATQVLLRLREALSPTLA